MTVTLASILAQVRSNLGDPDSVRYTDADLTSVIREALMRFSQVSPLVIAPSVTAATTDYFLSLSALSDVMDVLQVSYPYADGDSPGPDGLIVDWFYVVASGTPTIVRTDEPFTAGLSARVWYSTYHLLADLDGGEATTLPANAELALATGATAYAALARYQRIAELDGVALAQRNALRTTYETWMAKFELILANWKRLNPIPTGPLPTSGWPLPIPNKFSGGD